MSTIRAIPSVCPEKPIVGGPQDPCFPFKPGIPTFRSDKDVWAGAGSPMPINTGDGISDAELQAIAMIFANNPRDAAIRLFEDSSNGTPVVYERVYQESRAKLTVKATVVNGAITLEGLVEPTAELFNSSDLAAVMKYTNAEEQLPKLAVTLSGKVGNDGVIRGLGLKAVASDLPTVSTDKLAERAEAEAGGKEAAAIEDPAERETAVGDLIGDLFDYAERFIPKNLAALISEAPESMLSYSMKEDATVVELAMNDGTFALTGKHIAAGEKLDPNEIDIVADLKGSVEDRKDIDLDTASLSTKGDIAVMLPSSSGEMPKISVNGLPADEEQIQMLGMAVGFLIQWFMGG